jgi:DNA-binding transcriptional regulator YdaS (Cro superfamily)
MQMENKRNQQLITACSILGGQSAMADMLNVSCPTVNQWVKGKRPIPAKQCPKIEKLVLGKVKCEQLRSDIDWSYLRGTNSDKAA